MSPAKGVYSDLLVHQMACGWRTRKTNRDGRPPAAEKAKRASEKEPSDAFLLARQLAAAESPGSTDGAQADGTTSFVSFNLPDRLGGLPPLEEI